MPPEQLEHASTLAEVRALPADAVEVLVDLLDDQMAVALSRLSHLRRVVHAGSSRITDEGVCALCKLAQLEELDLEWSEAVTDAALELLATMPRLRYVDLSFCSGISDLGVARLRGARPELEVDR